MAVLLLITPPPPSSASEGEGEGEGDPRFSYYKNNNKKRRVDPFILFIFLNFLYKNKIL
jgi:hypothetical protein